MLRKQEVAQAVGGEVVLGIRVGLEGVRMASNHSLGSKRVKILGNTMLPFSDTESIFFAPMHANQNHINAVTLIIKST